MSLAAESVEAVPEEVWFLDENGANFWAVVVALLLLRPLRPGGHHQRQHHHRNHRLRYQQKSATITATATILIAQTH